jgi:membrane-associated phospholipid phosphatase
MIKDKFGVLFICVISFGILHPAVGQSSEGEDFGRFLTWSYSDASYWVTSWNTKRLARVAGATAILIPLSLIDEDVSEAAKDWGGGTSGSILDTANEFGGPAAVIIPTAVFGLSLLGNSHKTQDAAFTSLQSLVYSTAIVFSIKMIVGRSRPDAEMGAHDFNPFSGAASFSSGHTSTAFAIVMPWVFYYPGLPTYVAAAVATGTSIARLEKQKHWLTDVLASIAISTSISYFLTKRHQNKSSTGLSIHPSIGPKSISLSMRLDLK